jgi:hypothetical protein
MEEPSVLDWLKEKLAFWRRRSPVVGDEDRLSIGEPGSNHLIEAEELEDQTIIAKSEEYFQSEPPVRIVAEFEEVRSSSSLQEKSKKVPYRLPWRAILAVISGLIGQQILGPETRNVTIGIIFYGFAISFLVWGLIVKEWVLCDLPETIREERPHVFRRGMFLLAILMMAIAFLLLGGNRFNIINLILWLLAIFYAVLTFSEFKPRINFRQQLTQTFSRFRFPWKIQLDGFTFLFIVVILISVFFRIYHLNQVPAEMISDHAEKLLDTGDVLNGQYSIFFPRNTGREAFQLYWTALISVIFGTGLTFTSLKIGTAIAGLFTLPFIYLLGKEMGSKWGGLAGMLFGGVAYWPNVITRIGLRFTYYAAFTAPALYFFLRGLRRSNRNDIIWAGIFLGMGLHGYTPMRIVPFLIIIIAIIFILSKIGHDRWLETTKQVGIIALVSAAVALPLLRFASQYPELVTERAFSRLGDINNPLPGSPIVIFLQNFWKSATMFFWSNGDIWPHSIPNYPALDTVMAVFYLFGSVLLIARFFRKRTWQDLSLLISVPMLMMPSILSLAYPAENPSLNRTSAAFIPVVLIAGLAFEAFIRAIYQPLNNSRGKWLSIITAGILIAVTLGQNFNLVFDKYAKQYQLSAWNTSEIGGLIKQFSDTVGTRDTAYVVGYPYWVDTRLVAYNAGFPGKDFAIWSDQFELTLDQTSAKLFILYSLDTEGLRKLTALYPNGSSSYHKSAVEGKDFYVFFVPPEGTVQP